MQESAEGVTMDKAVDDDAEYVATFEETLKRFMGLSSEEIWELQRILVRRVRCKISESLSPEGKTAMKQVKQEMHERELELQKMAMSSATLVTELFDLGSRIESDIPRQNGEGTEIVLTVADDTDKTKSHADDEIEQVANMNVTETSGASVQKETTEDDVAKDNVAAAGYTNADADDNQIKDEVAEERRQSRSSSRCSSRNGRKANSIGGTTDQLEAETAENNKREVTSTDVPGSDDTSKDQTDLQENPDMTSGQKSSEETGTDADNQGNLGNDEKNSSSMETNSSETQENENVVTST